ncbi:hypothetical protein NTGM5_480113 [Candidatus Nitrotoga sp. M5]|nr:hypothetical protein NTGM5_480113 [Candidatus Nitrotoga sp. M5]
MALFFQLPNEHQVIQSTLCDTVIWTFKYIDFEGFEWRGFLIDLRLIIY